MAYSRTAGVCVMLVALLACAPVRCGRQLKQDLPSDVAECSTVAYLINSTMNLNYLTTALDAAGLLGTLDDPYATATVFAPVDTAFEALLTQLNTTVDSLLADPSLLPILLYHVVPGVFLSTDLVDGTSLVTLLGQNLTIAVSQAPALASSNTTSLPLAAASTASPVVQVEAAGSTATVVQADLLACEGVVHLIDTVLLPDILNVTAADNATTVFLLGDGSGNPQGDTLFVETTAP